MSLLVRRTEPLNSPILQASKDILALWHAHTTNLIGGFRLNCRRRVATSLLPPIAAERQPDPLDLHHNTVRETPHAGTVSRTARELLEAEVTPVLGGEVLNAKLLGPQVHLPILVGFFPRFEVIGGID